MISLYFMLQRGEITLKLRHPPTIAIGENGKIADVAFHKDDQEGVRDFLRYIDWGSVTAVLQYPEEPNKSGSGEGRPLPQPFPYTGDGREVCDTETAQKWRL